MKTESKRESVFVIADTARAAVVISSQTNLNVICFRGKVILSLINIKFITPETRQNRLSETYIYHIHKNVSRFF